MIWLVLGLLLWTVPHLLKRVAPGVHKGLGASARGLVSAGAVIGAVLMVIGYRTADPVFLWQLPAFSLHLNNLLMLIALLLAGLSHSKGRLRRHLRHPLLLSVVVWAIAHLLVNGDLPSLVLFGGLGLWAIAEILLINRSQPAYKPPVNLSARGDVLWIVASVVAFGLIGLVHGLVGPSPFPGA